MLTFNGLVVAGGGLAAPERFCRVEVHRGGGQVHLRRSQGAGSPDFPEVSSVCSVVSPECPALSRKRLLL